MGSSMIFTSSPLASMMRHRIAVIRLSSAALRSSVSRSSFCSLFPRQFLTGCGAPRLPEMLRLKALAPALPLQSATRCGRRGGRLDWLAPEYPARRRAALGCEALLPPTAGGDFRLIDSLLLSCLLLQCRYATLDL